MKIAKYSLIAVGIAASSLLFPALAESCPFCFSSSSENLLHTYYISAIFLSLLPFGIVALFAILLYRNRRSLNRKPKSNQENLTDTGIP